MAANGNNAAQKATNNPLVWIDCEASPPFPPPFLPSLPPPPPPTTLTGLQMTGLDPDTDVILEIYCLVTDGNLNLLQDEGFHAVIHHPQSRLDRMDSWCTETHGGTGLTSAVLASTTTPEQAARGLYEYITRLVPGRRVGLLAGSSVHVDKEFLRRGPYATVIEHLHYRLLDVSAIKEAARRWSPESVLEQVPRKGGSHKARDDILDSIGEAKYYRDAIFRVKA